MPRLLRITLLIILVPIFSMGQPAVPFNPAVTNPRISSVDSRAGNRAHAVEICGNGIDDDGNGLADEKDFACYYSSVGQDGCAPTKIIWGANGSHLYWFDTETGVYHFVGRMSNLNIYDITWSSDGKIYILDSGNAFIWEVDPYTAAVTFVWSYRDFSIDNSLTSDSEGNLYTTGRHFSNLQKYGILKINIKTGEWSEVADLKPHGVGSAGDLCFLNGKLYLACSDSKIAVINVNTGKVDVFPLLNSTTKGSYGLATLGDGYLYQCDKDKIYQIDPATMRVASTPYFDFHNSEMGFSGLCTYNEHCNAPVCKVTLDINIVSPQPYCSAAGVLLRGNGTGIGGEVVYRWTLPNGDTVTGKELNATWPGMYGLTYYSVTDYCGARDSVWLDILTSPSVHLGNDTILCSGDQLQLQPNIGPHITRHEWQDGSDSPQYSVTSPGLYKLTVSNACGFVTDTIIIKDGNASVIDLGVDSLICPGSTINLHNDQPKLPWDKYKWSDGSNEESITVKLDGLYWLESSNSCGVIRDSILVSFKDSCTCFPFYPNADLGSDVQLCSYETIKLRNLTHQAGFRYNWQNGKTDPFLDVKDPGIYWVDVTTYCGTEKDSIIITPKTSGCERKVIVPSAFTPDNNGMNDVFRPTVFGSPVQYEFTIYNRWGEIVFRSTSTGEGWNGTTKGRKQDTGLYVWTCSYQFSGEQTIHNKGTVALIR